MDAAASTSVHTEETTVHFDSSLSYREYRERSVLSELDATKQLYSFLDSESGKSRLSLLAKCRQFAWFVRDRETDLVHVASNSCRLRWCPMCTQSRTAYICQNIVPWAEKQRFLRFLTLTLLHTSSSLSNQIDYLYKCFRKLRLDKQFKKLCKGGIWFFQAKLDKNNEYWHPHIHCLIVGKFIPQSWLSGKWLHITGNSNIVDIRGVLDCQKTTDYIARYAARPANLSNYSLNHRFDLYKAFHGRRLCGTWGKARVCRLSPPRLKDQTKFERLGNWSTVLNMAKTDKIALKILQSWLDRTTLPPGYTMAHIDLWIDTGIDDYVVDRQRPKDYQSSFW